MSYNEVSAVARITLFVFFACFAPVSSLAAFEVGEHAIVETKALNVRTGPGTSFRKQGRITSGFGVKILDVSGNWVKVQIATKEIVQNSIVVARSDKFDLNIIAGWVMKSYLRDPDSPYELSQAQLSSGELYLKDIPITEKYSSSKGEVFVSRRGYDSTLVIGHEKIALSHYRADLDQVADNWFILTEYSGGTACPASKSLVDSSKSPASVLDFGICGDLHDVEIVDGSIELSAGTLPGEGEVVYVYDGRELKKTNRGLKDRDDVLNPYDPMAWIGSSPYEYVTAPQLEGFLIKTMGLDELDTFRHSVIVGSKFEHNDGWVTASGCKAGQCTTFVGAIAISVETGEPFFMYRRNRTEEWKYFGNVPNVLPAGIRDVRYNY